MHRIILRHTPRHPSHLRRHVHSRGRHPSLRHPRHSGHSSATRHTHIDIHSTHMARRSPHWRCPRVIIEKLTRGDSIEGSAREPRTHIHTGGTGEPAWREIHLSTGRRSVWVSTATLNHLWVHAWWDVVELGAGVTAPERGLVSDTGMGVCAWWGLLTWVRWRHSSWVAWELLVLLVSSLGLSLGVGNFIFEFFLDYLEEWCWVVVEV